MYTRKNIAFVHVYVLYIVYIHVFSRETILLNKTKHALLIPNNVNKNIDFIMYRRNEIFDVSIKTIETFRMRPS